MGTNEKHRELLLALSLDRLVERHCCRALHLGEAGLGQLLLEMISVEPVMMNNIRHVGRMEVARFRVEIRKTKCAAR